MAELRSCCPDQALEPAPSRASLALLRGRRTSFLCIILFEQCVLWKRLKRSVCWALTLGLRWWQSSFAAGSARCRGSSGCRAWAPHCPGSHGVTVCPASAGERGRPRNSEKWRKNSVSPAKSSYLKNQRDRMGTRVASYRVFSHEVRGLSPWAHWSFWGLSNKFDHFLVKPMLKMINYGN